METGELYLNTLYSFATGTGLNDAQADLAEGGLCLIARAHDGSPIAARISSLDTWTLCFSKTLSSEIMERFSAECAFQILSYDFFRAVSRSIASRADCGKLYRIRYLTRHDLNRMEDSNFRLSGIDDPVISRDYFAREIKSAAFAWQDEVRLCFEPREQRYRAYVVFRETQGAAFQIGIEGGEPLEVVVGSYEEVSVNYRGRLCEGLIEPIRIICPDARQFVCEVTT